MSDCPVCVGIPGYDIHTCDRVSDYDLESSRSLSCYESLEMRLAEVKQNWLQLVANADDQSPCDVVVARGDYEVMMSLICGDS